MRGREEYLMTKSWTRLVMAATGFDPMDAEKIVNELPFRILKEPLCEPVCDSGGVRRPTQKGADVSRLEEGYGLLLMLAVDMFNA